MHIPIYDTVKKNKEANNTIQNAQSKYDSAQRRMEKQRKWTSNQLEELGTLKLEIWSEDIKEFIDVYQFFKEIKIEGKITGKEVMAIPVKPDWNINEMQKVSMNASEVIKGGLASVSAGALAGIASYGAVSMFGTASTGTAISALSGAAAHNATLAWFGGGAISAGGAGMEAGTLVLGGIAVVPIILVADTIMHAKADEKLAEARKIYQEAKLAAEKLNTVTDFMKHIEEVSNGYVDFLKEFRLIYKSLISEVESLVMRLQNGYVGGARNKISFDSLSIQQKKLLQITWLMTQVLYNVLKAPLLTKRGDLHKNAEMTLTTAREVTLELSSSYRYGTDISDVTIQKISSINYKESLYEKVKNFFGNANYSNYGSNNYGGRISGIVQNFFQSGVQGFVSLALLIFAIHTIMSAMIIKGLILLFACYIVYPGVDINGTAKDRIIAAVVVSIIGLIL